MCHRRLGFQLTPHFPPHPTHPPISEAGEGPERAGQALLISRLLPSSLPSSTRRHPPSPLSRRLGTAPSQGTRRALPTRPLYLPHPTPSSRASFCPSSNIHTDRESLFFFSLHLNTRTSLAKSRRAHPVTRNNSPQNKPHLQTTSYIPTYTAPAHTATRRRTYRMPAASQQLTYTNLRFGQPSSPHTPR